MDIEQYNILITEIKSLDLKDITSFHYSIIALDKVLPRDVVDEILKKYFLRNPQKILSYYHIIFNRLTLHEIKPILIFCFEEIKKSIDEGNFLVEKNAGENHFISCFDSYFNFLLTIIIQKSKESPVIALNFSKIISDCPCFITDDNLRKLIIKDISRMRIDYFYLNASKALKFLSLDFFKMLYEYDLKFIKYFNITLAMAICKSCEIETFLWFSNFHNVSFSYQYYRYGIEAKNFTFLNWYHGKNKNLDENFYRLAKEENSIEIFYWLYEKNCPWFKYLKLDSNTPLDLPFIEFANERNLPYNIKFNAIYLEDLNSDTETNF